MLRRLAVEILEIAPSVVLVTVLVQAWNSLVQVVLLGLETRLLKIIEAGLASKDGLDVHALINVVMTRILLVLSSSLINHWSYDAESRGKNRINRHYDEMLLRIRMESSLSAVMNNHSDEHLSASDPWTAFEAALSLSTKIFAVISQLGFMLHIIRSGNHGLIFALLCIAKPLMRLFGRQDIWSMRECSLSESSICVP
ncbi:hypothetical protein GYMLUDRAFT_161104 [Collybiopsis luxurians FD-317 M1]|nr:hypothetical protein GYMLUDRAFT_161104 [Collybiopsis luxurians FD-317 M1]